MRTLPGVADNRPASTVFNLRGRLKLSDARAALANHDLERSHLWLSTTLTLTSRARCEWRPHAHCTMQFWRMMLQIESPMSVAPATDAWIPSGAVYSG